MILEHEIVIAAPPEVVWGVTMDIENWPKWAPTFTSVSRLDQGPLQCGSAAMIKQPGLPPAKWVITTMTPLEQFTWETQVRGIRMVATHQLSIDPAGTSNLLRIEMFGFMARLLWPLIRGAARQSLEKENAGLMAKCEPLDA